MNRREAIKGAAAAMLLPAIQSTPANAEPIKGVGILRYPTNYSQARDTARKLSENIRQGVIICMPSDTDDYGNYVWDFKIEGGDPGQVQIKRSEAP